MTTDLLVDVASGALLLLGSALALVAAIGLVRFPDVLTRMHAATKPQTLGLLLVLAGLALRVRDPGALTIIALVALFSSSRPRCRRTWSRAPPSAPASPTPPASSATTSTTRSPPISDTSGCPRAGGVPRMCPRRGEVGSGGAYRDLERELDP